VILPPGCGNIRHHSSPICYKNNIYRSYSLDLCFDDINMYSRIWVVFNIRVSKIAKSDY